MKKNIILGNQAFNFSTSCYNRADNISFLQRSDLPQTTIIKDPNEFYNLVHNPSVEMRDTHFVNDDLCLVNWNYTSDEFPTANFTSIAIAAHVTAQARLHLYKYLEKLQDRVLYCDTDSVIFLDSPND